MSRFLKIPQEGGDKMSWDLWDTKLETVMGEQILRHYTLDIWKAESVTK